MITDWLLIFTPDFTPGVPALPQSHSLPPLQATTDKHTSLLIDLLILTDGKSPTRGLGPWSHGGASGSVFAVWVDVNATGQCGTFQQDKRFCAKRGKQIESGDRNIHTKEENKEGRMRVKHRTSPLGRGRRGGGRDDRILGQRGQG